MNEPAKQEISAIEVELLEEKSREGCWQSRSDWIDDDEEISFREDAAYRKRLDEHIIRRYVKHQDKHNQMQLDMFSEKEKPT